MATSTEIAKVRRMTDAATEDYTDSEINTIIDEQSGDLNLAASEIWEQKAAKYAALVDTSESGSSRKQSALFDKALQMAGFYKGKADEAAEDLSHRSRTRRIVRL